MVKVLVRNTHATARRGFYDNNSVSVVLRPGEERVVDIRESLVNVLTRMDGDVVVVSKIEDAPEPAPRTYPTNKLGQAVLQAKSAVPDPVPVPATWRNLGWNDMRKLAIQVSGHPIKNRLEAEAALEAVEHSDGLYNSDRGTVSD